MTEDLKEQTDILFHSPEGTVLEIAPGFWKVRGKTQTYDVCWDEESCSCPQFVHRLKGFGTCRHLACLREFLKRGPHTCPMCSGEGCSGCDGLGRVSSEVYPTLLEIRKAEDEAHAALLKEIFA
jgi:hypothetical protein